MRQRIRFALVLAFAALLVLVPGALAAGSANGDDVAIRINGPVTVAAGEALDVAVVVNGDAAVQGQGTVANTLVVVNGSATVAGAVDGDIVVARGHLTLEPSARVHNVTLIESDLTRSSGAQITGTLQQRARAIPSGFLTVLSIFWWIGVTSLALLLGLLLVAIGRRTLAASTRLISERPAESILAGVIVAVGLPILTIVLMLTVVGIPVGIALIFVAMAIAFAGYLTCGLWLGGAILAAVSSRRPTEHPYLAVVIGVLLLQIVVLIPFLGGLVGLIASIVGAGALALQAWGGWRGSRRAVIPAATAGGDRSPAT